MYHCCFRVLVRLWQGACVPKLLHNWSLPSPYVPGLPIIELKQGIYGLLVDAKRDMTIQQQEDS